MTVCSRDTSSASSTASRKRSLRRSRRSNESIRQCRSTSSNIYGKVRAQRHSRCPTKLEPAKARLPCLRIAPAHARRRHDVVDQKSSICLGVAAARRHLRSHGGQKSRSSAADQRCSSQIWRMQRSPSHWTIARLAQNAHDLRDSRTARPQRIIPLYASSSPSTSEIVASRCDNSMAPGRRAFS
jgi:hypothetical protein